MDRLLSGSSESPCADRDRSRFCYLLPLLRRSSGADRVFRVPVDKTAATPLGRVFSKDSCKELVGHYSLRGCVARQGQDAIRQSGDVSSWPDGHVEGQLIVGDDGRDVAALGSQR